MKQLCCCVKYSNCFSKGFLSGCCVFEDTGDTGQETEEHNIATKCLEKCETENCVGYEIYEQDYMYVCKTYTGTKSKLMTTTVGDNCMKSTCYLRKGNSALLFDLAKYKYLELI